MAFFRANPISSGFFNKPGQPKSLLKHAHYVAACSYTSSICWRHACKSAFFWLLAVAPPASMIGN